MPRIPAVAPLRPQEAAPAESEPAPQFEEARPVEPITEAAVLAAGVTAYYPAELL